jgi:hypothetical protein
MDNTPESLPLVMGKVIPKGSDEEYTQKSDSFSRIR